MGQADDAAHNFVAGEYLGLHAAYAGLDAHL